MSPDLARLIKLQDFDATILDARQKIAAHPQRLAAADAQLAEAQHLLDAARQRLKDNQDAKRDAEKNVAVYQGRLTKFRDQQSSVKNNKEYQALGHEIETAQKDLANVEEAVIEQMVAADGITADVKQAEAAFAARKKEIDAARQAIAAELAELEAAAARAVEARSALIGEVDARVMATYDQVARVRKGIALSSATRDGLCSACHVRMRPTVFQQVRANNAIVQCESCQRILYYVPPPAPVDPPVTVA